MQYWRPCGRSGFGSHINLSVLGACTHACDPTCQGEIRIMTLGLVEGAYFFFIKEIKFKKRNRETLDTMCMCFPRVNLTLKMMPNGHSLEGIGRRLNC